MTDANILRGITFFDGLTVTELSQLSEICTISKCKKGDRIFGMGDTAENLYVVRSGTVNLSFQISIFLAKQDVVVDIKRPNDIFGWSALLEPHKLTLSARCGEDCELFQMRGAEVLAFCAREDHMGHILMRNLAKVISSRMDRIQGLFQKEIELNVPSS